jgi:SAM-dependent methyltransferase
MNIKKILKQSKIIRNIYFLFRGASQFFTIQPVSLVKKYIWFFNCYRKYYMSLKNENFKTFEFYPYLMDNTSNTPLEPTYFFQDTWAAKHLFELKPKHHYDIGSSAKTIGILSQFVPITMIDIRPIQLKLDNLFFKKGSILNLPFKDNSIETLSSLCVVEHIGLGRYGDPIDPFGSEKAIKEMKRVMKAGGVILFSVPVDRDNMVQFNANRSFTRKYILELFDGFEVLDEKYHYGTKMYNTYDKTKGFGTGLYKLKKKDK